MKILFLAPQPFYTERGTPIAVKLAVTALCRDGHQVDLLTYHQGEDIDIPGTRLFRAGKPPGVDQVPIGFSISKLLCDAWLMFKAFRLLRGGDYDVVHAVEESVFIGLVARLFWRFKLVYDMDSLMADQIAEKWPRAGWLLPVLRWFEHQAMKRADLVLAVCPLIAERAAGSAASGRVHLTPDVAFAPGAIDHHLVQDLRELCPQPGPISLYVGNLESYQGIDTLLEAHAMIDPGTRGNLLIIGGTEGSIIAYQEKADYLGLRHHVRFLGQRPLDHLYFYLRQADILCSPRLKGVNTPMKIYSYMLAGRAILATDIPSHSQVLDSSSALLVAPDAIEMSEGWAYLIASPELRDELGYQAAAHAATHYSEKAFQGRLRDAYAVLNPPTPILRGMAA
jgi:glycosyltransferase involved in cell wall biosynthesis